jgi:hypothetical protein
MMKEQISDDETRLLLNGVLLHGSNDVSRNITRVLLTSAMLRTCFDIAFSVTVLNSLNIVKQPS